MHKPGDRVYLDPAHMAAHRPRVKRPHTGTVQRVDRVMAGWLWIRLDGRKTLDLWPPEVVHPLSEKETP